MNTILIDNYDSFTWNVYQYLCQLGCTVIVKRNDEDYLIQYLEELCHQKLIKNIIISPGPGVPSTDSGFSKNIIDKYKGKVPILGICMGLQCITEVFGGSIMKIGTIIHGKTSPMKHDSIGIFEGLSDGCLMTRYHSLAPNPHELPDCLMVSARSEDGVIQALRHNEFCITGVQFHPESILSTEGLKIFDNFLKWKHGIWDSSMKLKIQISKSKETGLSQDSILNKIVKQRLEDINKNKNIIGQSFDDLKSLYELGLVSPPLNLLDRLKEDSKNGLTVMAEIKRASPSKGIINQEINASKQALLYARGGASVISVLTEPNWFKGSIIDMSFVSKAVSRMINRPLVLRKDFILDKYQILEARLNGADTILLIVSCLNETDLKSLLDYSVSLGMVPLVEVFNQDEMNLAIKVGAKVIGVNNRNLHSFQVDLNNTLNILPSDCNDVIIAALSGISSFDDVKQYRNTKVNAVLIGEALMKSSDPISFIRSIVSNDISIKELNINEETYCPLVKVCGIRSLSDAQMCVDKGVDLLGLIFVPKSKRYITIETAKEIVNMIRKNTNNKETTSKSNLCDWFGVNSDMLKAASKPLFVALFQDLPIDQVLSICSEIKPDFVQLHGNETAEYGKRLGIPYIKVFHVKEQGLEEYQQNHMFLTGFHHFALLDAQNQTDVKGGMGLKFDWNLAKSIKLRYSDLYNCDFPLFLAGGLTPDNVQDAVKKVRPLVVDVASGVEVDGFKSPDLVDVFVKNAKSAFK